jgi:uncharacterized protein YjbJ (UPF0337 family)
MVRHSWQFADLRRLVRALVRLARRRTAHPESTQFASAFQPGEGYLIAAFPLKLVRSAEVPGIGTGEARWIAGIWNGGELPRIPTKKRKRNLYMSAQTLQIKGDWNIMKGKLKKAYGELTDDDLTYVRGHEDELVGRLQKRLGKTAEQVRAMLQK